MAHIVWERFGDVANYVEPFAGSLAVLLGRPHLPQTETVNDIDCYLANFWRALSNAPDDVAEWADWPVNEADLHARHLWLVNREDFRERMKVDPDYFDAKIAGWWVWGVSQWIGSGWCSRPDWAGRTNAARAGRGIHRKLPHLGDAGRGVNRQLPHLGNAGRGGDPAASPSGGCAVAQKRPMLSGNGQGCGVHADRSAALLDYFAALATRLRRVRVCCGDWLRVMGPSVTAKHGVTGVFLDPPYDMRIVSAPLTGRDGTAPADRLYLEHDNNISAAVRRWAVENGGNPLLQIALCGYEEEHGAEMPDDWDCIAWKAPGGYGSQAGSRGNENGKRERIWFSPHCLGSRQGRIF